MTATNRGKQQGDITDELADTLIWLASSISLTQTQARRVLHTLDRYQHHKEQSNES